ncbi:MULTISPECIES: hypothetical protein [Vibrio]|uniref:Helix-turn-helix domain protein n=2 Tax=Vibrio TaxID=662 RepID=A0A1R4LQK0_VIBR1|nr:MULTISPECIES: hypothetical protein [Vibrio]SIO96114.1 hypothetical protein VSP9026_03874 [Vibrio spartinae]SJN58886.1 hypothetical protein VR7878_03098 [Vibrio ruber DSM 16370]
MKTNEHEQQSEPLYISDEQIRDLLDISQPTLWRLTKNGGLPESISGMRGKRPYAKFKAWAIERGMMTATQFLRL